MGTKWLIENKEQNIPMWYDGWGWNNDANQCRQFDTKEEAKVYMGTVLLDIADTDMGVTEHIFMSPISTEEKLN